jgi:hypothetical protein
MKKQQTSQTKAMTDKPKFNGYLTREAINRSAELEAETVRLLKPLVDGEPMSEVERQRRIDKAVINSLQVLRHLEGQGAPTRPD